MQWPDFVHWAFQALLTGCVVYIIADINKLKEKADKILENQNEMRTEDAKKTEKLNWHERELYKMDTRIDKVESIVDKMQ